jgi:hypothetical protein
MNIVLYTQRVEIVKSYGERRDCADQNIAKFIFLLPSLFLTIAENLTIGF